MELKGCPFCGAGSDEISIKCKYYHGGAVEVQGLKFWFVECLPCDARTGHRFDGDAEHTKYKDGKEWAIADWNRRT